MTEKQHEKLVEKLLDNHKEHVEKMCAAYWKHTGIPPDKATLIAITDTREGGLIKQTLYFEEKENTEEEKRVEICNHCLFEIRLSNPSGYCNHVYYPHHCDTCKENRKPTSWVSESLIIGGKYCETESG